MARYRALGAGLRLHCMDRLDPKRPEPCDQWLVVITDVMGVAPPGGFQVAQQAAPAER
ncbi:MAG TPA: hypothetical protein VFX88_11620 [Actinomycetota bacterium]|nr:hypothetical protein [Actinomycetota bacterium]